MREPEYLSPTSMSKWAEEPNNYYSRYLADVPLPEEPQTQAMSVGSAFDAFVKSFLYESLFGSPSAPGNDPRFARDAIFEEQVAPHNRDFALVAGEDCLRQYRLLGALDGLMVDLGRSKGPPKFEMDVRGKVSHGRDGVINHVPFRVKPDLHYINEHGAFVIHDWKVNGYCSASGRSPTPGFVKARRKGKMPWAHDDCTIGTHKGITINVRKPFERYDHEWARQCAVGAWVCGAPVGSDFVAVIHQLACSKGKITVAEHAGLVSEHYQDFIHSEAAKLWQALTQKFHDDACWRHVDDPSDHRYYLACECKKHVFRHISIEDSIALCSILDKRQAARTASRTFLNPALD